MLRTIEMYTNEYKDTTQKEIRKKKEKNRGGLINGHSQR